MVNTKASEPFSRMCHEPRNVLDKIVKLCQHVSTFLKFIVGFSTIEMLKRGAGFEITAGSLFKAENHLDMQRPAF